jgi:hypothetical protein
MSCNHLKQEREKYWPSYCCNNANTFKCNELCSLCNIVVLEKLCKFIKIINMKDTPPGYCNCNFFHTCTKLNMLYVIVYFSVTLCIWFKRIKYMHSFIHSFSNRMCLPLEKCSGYNSPPLYSEIYNSCI